MQYEQNLHLLSPIILPKDSGELYINPVLVSFGVLIRH